MNLLSPMSFIPPQLQLAARLIALLVAVLAVAGVTHKVDAWRYGREIADLHAEHAQTVADAYKASVAAQKKADAEHAQTASDLAALSASHLEALQRSEHANDLLRADVAAGTRVVRVAASCPAGTGGVPQAAAGGRLDPAAAAVLAPAAGQSVLDLRAGIVRLEGQLAACQDAAVRLTEQGARR